MKIVKEIMVPLSDYPTVSEDATLKDAVEALEKAQKKLDPSRYQHRAVLVYDDNKKIVGTCITHIYPESMINVDLASPPALKVKYIATLKATTGIKIALTRMVNIAYCLVMDCTS